MLLARIYDKIFGTSRISFSADDVPRVSRIIGEYRLTTEPILLQENGTASVLVRDSDARRFARLCRRYEIDFRLERASGLPRMISRYHNRPGILIGAVLFLLITFFSGKIVWNFDIVGNELVSDREIIEKLGELGFSSGAYIPSVDFDRLQNDILINNDTLAWLSVNMDGNLARVEVRERVVVPSKYVPTKGLFANIVASEDGVIESCLVKSGKIVVGEGDVVRRGELLISGVIDVGDREVRYEYADGEILARVNRKIEATVPLDYAKTVETGAKTTDIAVKIFGKSINIRGRGSIVYNNYGKIEDEKQVVLPGGVLLPIFITKTVYTELCSESVTLTNEQALSVARAEASQKLRELSDTARLLSVCEDVCADEDVVTVTLDVCAVVNIAANYGFDIGND